MTCVCASQVSPFHIPQLYMHMICAEAESVLFASCSATRGANIFRLQRNESLMQTMLKYVDQFASQFGSSDADPPPINFFSNEDAYRSFVRAMAKASSRVELVAYIPNQEVQRAKPEHLFL
jgi:hypothetical protein